MMITPLMTTGESATESPQLLTGRHEHERQDEEVPAATSRFDHERDRNRNDPPLENNAGGATTTTTISTTTTSPTSTIPATTTTSTAQAAAIDDDELFKCDSIQLHLIGKIQGQSGHVIHLSYPLGHIVAVDAKILDLSFIRAPSWASLENGGSAAHMLGTSLHHWVPDEIFQLVFMAMHSLRKDLVYRTFRFWRGYALTISVATSHENSIIAVEIEQDDRDPIQATDSYRSSLDSLSRIMDLYTNDSIVNVACDNLFDMFPEYDRGMVYRFHDDMSGEVIHEVRRGAIQSSYLGHRFPKYDIPQSARKLYQTNILRYIRNVDEPDVPVLAKNGGQSVDLTQLRCRACAKPHLIYMKNMGVKSSLSIAIIVDNQLWGLFAFHAYHQTFAPTLHQRISCETVASMVSARVEALVRKCASARIVSMGETLMRWSLSHSTEHNLSVLGPEILDIVQADVLVAKLGDKIQIVAGNEALAPNENTWQVLSKQPSGVLQTASTRKEIQELFCPSLSEMDCPANGFVHFRERSTHIFLGRKSVSKDIKWAGNPDQPKIRTKDGMLHPRNSFAMYMEKAKQESRTWSPADLNVIMVLKDRICSGHANEWMTALLRNDIEEANMRYFTAMDRAKENSDFFAHMSHELRTPFHATMACLNILHDSIDSMSTEEIKDMIKTALSSGNHMINLLNDILHKSKNKYLLNKTVRHTVYYHALAKEAFGSLKALAVNLNVKFDYKVIPANEDIVMATDRTKIIQIVSNTVNNAMKFSCGGSVSVKASLLSTMLDAFTELEQTAHNYNGFVCSMKKGKMYTDTDHVKEFINGFKPVEAANDKTVQQWLCLSVTDSGCGMKPKELVEMLQPYTQGNAGSQPFVGTGLGLYICVSLCHQLGGFFACSSTPNNGTNCFVGIPVEILNERHPQLNDLSEDQPIFNFSKIAIYGPIVIVDDNKVNVKVLHRQLSIELKKANIEVELICVDGGEEAYEVYKNRLPSLLIVDYHMPGMDGVAVTKAIRKFEVNHIGRPSYILSYTADISTEAKELLLQAGSNEVMSKPPVPGFVAQLVKRMEVVTSTDVMTNYRR